MSAVMNVPEELNGFPVVRVEQHKNCATVVVSKPGELVVATWWPELGATWHWGHYIPLNAEAGEAVRNTFEVVARRNARR